MPSQKSGLLVLQRAYVQKEKKINGRRGKGRGKEEGAENHGKKEKKEKENYKGGLLLFATKK